jgi:hypothetical protein
VGFQQSDSENLAPLIDPVLIERPGQRFVDR